jgi:hypothetical protein
MRIVSSFFLSILLITGVLLFSANAELVGHWDFNEGSGDTRYDKSVYGKDIPVTGATYVNAVDGKALHFDGDDYALRLDDMSHLNYDRDKDFSISVLIKPQGTGDHFVLGHKSGTNNGWVIRCRQGWFNFNGEADNQTYMAADDSDVKIETWYHYVINHNSSIHQVELYKNGSLLSSTPYGTDVIGNIGTGYLCIGSRYELVSTFIGEIDDLKIYSRMLTLSEITAEWLKYKEKATLVAHWDFNEGSGDTLRDKSIYGNHGIRNGATWITNGIDSGALSFDGFGTYVRISDNSSLDITSEITIAAWAKPHDLSIGSGGNHNYPIVRKGYDGTSLPYSICFMGNSLAPTRLEAGSYNNGWNYAIYPLSSFTEDVWYHFCFTFNGSFFKLYINGNIVDSVAHSNPLPTNDKDVLIGGYDNEGVLESIFNGIIDEFYIYNQALSASEIENLYIQFSLPTLVSAVASDGTTGQAGIDEDDYVLFTFENAAPTGLFTINESNVDSLLPLNNGHTWLSGFGTLDSAQWNPDSTMLLVNLSTTVSPPTVAVGDSVSLTENGNKVAITGSFNPPTSIVNFMDKNYAGFNISHNLINSSLTISFNNEMKNAQVRIFKINGRQVASFKDIKQNQVVWKTDNITSGVYFIKFWANGYDISSKVTIIK